MTWSELNKVLRTADERLCADLLATELSGPARKGHLLRIHARFNLLRARRERKELQAKAIGR